MDPPLREKASAWDYKERKHKSTKSTNFSMLLCYHLSLSETTICGNTIMLHATHLTTAISLPESYSPFFFSSSCCWIRDTQQAQTYMQTLLCTQQTSTQVSALIPPSLMHSPLPLDLQLFLHMTPSKQGSPTLSSLAARNRLVRQHGDGS